MKMLVSDFDGTLFNKDYKENVKEINNFVNKDNLFVICTGRNLNRLLVDLDKDLKFNYLICSDGAVIYDKDFNEIYRSDIEPKVVDGVVNIINNNDCFSDLDLIHGASLDDRKVNAIYAIYDKNKIDMATYALEYIQKTHPQIHGYLSKNYININNRLATKSSGIKKLIEIEHLEPLLVYTIGDDINDQDMLLDYIGTLMNSSTLNLSLPVVNSVNELVKILK